MQWYGLVEHSHCNSEVRTEKVNVLETLKIMLCATLSQPHQPIRHEEVAVQRYGTLLVVVTLYYMVRVIIHIYGVSHMNLSEALPTTAIDTVPEFHAEALQATASVGLAQGPYVVARVRFEPRDPPVKGHRLYQLATMPTNVGFFHCAVLW